MEITFVPMTEHDLSTLCEWLGRPHGEAVLMVRDRD